MSETSTELTLRQKTEQVVARLTHPEVLAQIEELLPDNVPLQRFLGVAKTAVRTNPDLVKADPSSLVNAVIKCAQDGLYPDGRQAALVIYKGKVGYLRMIAGVRTIAALYGWTIETKVVYEADEFDYTEEPPMISLRRARPGVERGKITHAYAKATHRDGRTMDPLVMSREDIAKHRAKAQTQAVWNEWEGPMSEKTVGHAMFKRLPLDPNDVRVARMLADEVDPADAMEQLYGPESIIEHVDLESGEITTGSPATASDEAAPGAARNLTDADTEPGDGNQQAGTADGAALPLAAAPVPGDDEPEPGPPVKQDDLAAAKAAGVASTIVEGGNWGGMTLAQVHETGEDGAKWFSYVLRHPGKYDPAFVAAVDTFVQGTPGAQLKAA